MHNRHNYNAKMNINLVPKTTGTLIEPRSRHWELRLHPNQSGSTWRGLQSCPAPCPHPRSAPKLGQNFQLEKKTHSKWMTIYARYQRLWLLMNYFSDFMIMYESRTLLFLYCWLLWTSRCLQISPDISVLPLYLLSYVVRSRLTHQPSWRVPASTHTSPSHRTRRRERQHQSGLRKNQRQTMTNPFRWWLGSMYDLKILPHICWFVGDSRDDG